MEHLRYEDAECPRCDVSGVGPASGMPVAASPPAGLVGAIRSS